MSKKVLLQLTAAIVIDSAIKRAGSTIEVPEEVAKNLLARGKAKVANTESTLNEPVDVEVPEESVEEVKPKKKSKK